MAHVVDAMPPKRGRSLCVPQQFLITLPVPICNFSDGDEYEPTGEFRRPRIGDYYAVNHYETDELQVKLAADNDHAICRIILRPNWKWPTELKGWGFAKDPGARGWVWWYETEPTRGTGSWHHKKGGVCKAVSLLAAFGISPPEITDWRVPVLNPNYPHKDASATDAKR